MGGRDGPESLGTMDRNQWARWTEIPTKVKSSSLDLLFLLPNQNFRHAFFTQIGSVEEDFTSRKERLD